MTKQVIEVFISYFKKGKETLLIIIDGDLLGSYFGIDIT